MKGSEKYVYNPETLVCEKVEDDGRGQRLRTVLKIAGFFPLALLYFWFYTSVLGLEPPKTAMLREENLGWDARMAIVNRRMELDEEALRAVEDRDDGVYRLIFGLNEISPGLKFSGLGGPNRYAALREAGAGQGLVGTVARLDTLTKRVYVRSKSMDEAFVAADNAGDMVSCIPAVPPVLIDKDVRLTSPFGYRSDPIHGHTRFHEGHDLATYKGNRVYATGDGTVEAAEFQFFGYGNVIIIDHGFGYKTRYAHLNAIDVTEGMKVKRGDLIGEVGSTGKSTGPHLHYEVLYRGTQVNPSDFYDYNMPVDEYKAMTERRMEESEHSKMSTTTELLRRKRK